MGKPAVFCRFAGCNLWSGLEKDRVKAICQFCDTDFVGGGKFKSAEELAKAVADTWTGSAGGEKLVVLTGDEPTLQIDTKPVEALHAQDFRLAMKTNGTILPAQGVDKIKNTTMTVQYCQSNPRWRLRVQVHKIFGVQ